GSTTQTFPKNEGSTTDLPASDRFSRDGFNLVGWLSDYDGEIYKPLASVTCPDVDVTFTAVWSPKNYNVIFKQGNGGANLKVAGLTDTQIICPEPDITVAGKYFAGWQDDKGDIYPAGSEYTILGAKPGVGIMLTAVWETGEAPITTEPAVTTTEPETTTTATVPQEILLGDANEDGVVDIADAAAIIQSLGNKDKYALSEQGAKNADVYNPGDGITGMDALAIQKLKANMITSLPEIVES
ncbi:MAG: dockerin type I repeat-containing protein, partial [Ruminococcus flavefaciens]|nr:dockerin type I repeat-containing protein [Ruminococcus flavefaciens]